MKPSYHLIVPLPGGVVVAPGTSTPGTMRLSVLFIPRLQDDGFLGEWTYDWRNWPSVVLGTSPGGPTTKLALDVYLDLGTGQVLAPPNTALTVNSPRWLSDDPSPAAWTATWGIGTPKPIRVDRFRPRLRNGSDLIAPMFDAAGLARSFEDLEDALVAGFADGPPGRDDLAAAIDLEAADDALSAYRAHMAPLTSAAPAPSTTADFHVGISYAMAHPALLRRLGLLVDLEVTLPPGLSGAFRVAVASNFDDVHLNYGAGKSVPVVVDVEADGWTAEGAGRWAAVGGSGYSFESVDFPSTVNAMSEAVSALVVGDSPPIPTIRSAGLELTRTGADLVAEIEQSWLERDQFETDVADHLRTGVPVAVPAGDGLTVAGRRYDIFDETTGDWYSLWQRTMPNGLVFPLDPALEYAVGSADEGWMTFTAFTEAYPTLRDPIGDLDPPADPNNELDYPKLTPAPPRFDDTPIRVSPLLAVWRGWSLAAQPPGRAFSPVAGAVDPEPNAPAAEVGAQVTVDYAVPPGVLPRLRYTRRYRMRARVVDLAGNSLELAEVNPGGTTQTELVRFGRTEPIGAPVVVRRNPRPVPGWGDTVTTVVIRSELGQSNGTVVRSSRLFFPAPTTQHRCELHGFPAPDGLFTDQATFDMMVARTASSIDDHVSADATTGEPVSDPVGAWRPAVSYLVEPAQAGVGFHDLPQTTTPQVVPVALAWPNHHAVSFELRAGTAAPVINADSTTRAGILVSLDQGFTRTVSAGAAIRSELLDHWASIQRLGAGLDADLEATILAGGHWRFAAPTSFTLVHAVRQPLTVPTIGPVTATRTFGSTGTALSGTLGIDVKSTGRVKVSVVWTDPIDSDASPTGVVDITSTRTCFEQAFDYAETTATPISAQSFELGDTKRHDARLSLEAVSRYWRHFTERATVRFLPSAETVELASVGISDLNVEVRLEGALLVPGVDYSVDAAAGTITRVPSGAILYGDDVEVDFVRLPFSRLSDEGGAGPYPFVIPNSAPPPPPSVAGVLPAFSRTTTVDGDTVTVVHEGQSMRIWLERPWYRSGPGELLGVLVGADSGTVVARDPLSPSGPSDPITLADLPAAVATRTGVFPGVDVAGHEVHFDGSTGRWFADVVISADIGYRPFVKLALVRFQPESVDQAHVGESVVSEPVRVGPSRTTTVVRNGTDLVVTVVGRELGNEVLLTVQESDADIADPALSWRDVGSAVVLVAGPAADPGSTSWTTTLPMPISERPIRVVIEDAELLRRQVDSGFALVRVESYVDAVELESSWTLPVTAPDAPDPVEVTPANRSLLVTWTEPDDGNSPIERYRLQRRVGAAAFGSDVEVAVTATSRLLTGLVNGTTYDVRVRAENAVGPGPWSTIGSGTPATTPPSAVGGLVPTAGHRAVLLRWTAPANGGSPLTTYRIERRQGAASWQLVRDLAPSLTAYIDRGVVNGSAYQYRVRAANAVGTGPWSTTGPVVPGAMTPAPTRRVDGFSGAGRILLVWRPTSGRGSPILRYAVERRTIGGVWGSRQTTASSVTRLQVSGLAGGSTWEFRVRAENAVGAGAWSTPVRVTVLASGAVPDAVHGVTVTAGSGSLRVEWIAAADNGSTVFLHTVEVRLPGGAWESVDVPATRLVQVFQGLVVGSTYEVRVRGVNVVGEGPWSTGVVGTVLP